MAQEQEAATLRLMDRLVGQRTVAVQEAPSGRATRCPIGVDVSGARSDEVDRCSIALRGLLPRCYLLLGLVTLAAAGAPPPAHQSTTATR